MQRTRPSQCPSSTPQAARAGVGELRVLSAVCIVVAGLVTTLAPPPIVQLVAAQTGSCGDPEDPCSGTCCDDGMGGQICCDSAENCCNNGCCADECIDDGLDGEICCPAGQVACNGSCCEGECLDDGAGGEVCCEEGQILCGGVCCDPDECCDTDDDGEADSCGFLCDSDDDGGDDACYLCDTNGNGNNDSCYLCNDGGEPGIYNACYLCDSDDDGQDDDCYLCDTDGDDNNDACYVCESGEPGIDLACYSCDIYNATGAPGSDGKDDSCECEGGGCPETISMAQELADCENRMQDPRVGAPNGCGTEQNPVDPNPCHLPNTSFEESCNEHDGAYTTCGKPRGDADNEFGDSMDAVCNAAGNPQCVDAQGQPNGTTCQSWADLYELGVELGGGNAYNGAQIDGCICCD